jgi:hypothetical protein
MLIFPATHGVRVNSPVNNREWFREAATGKGKLSMRMTSLSLALTVGGTLAMLSACDTPTRADFNALRSDVTSLEARVSAAETRANEAAASASQCQQVCERADRMFQQGLRK